MEKMVGAEARTPCQVPQSLSEPISSAAFLLCDGCYFLDFLYRQRGNANRSMFPDETGYECFVNHIHMEDFTKEGMLDVAFAVLSSNGVKWRTSGNSGSKTIRLK